MPDQSLVVFDVTPPRQYVASAAYRKDWQAFTSGYKGPIKFEIADLAVTVDGNMAYGHSIQRVSGMDAKGKPSDMTVRVTDVYRRINGKWLVVHEHVSVPVDLNTMQPDVSSKP
ncbi:MAG TPA: nuclear transport factor 2 family protein [Rhizomicrobium sp.]